MSDNFFDNLTFDIALDLYRAKIIAEAKQDKIALMKLELQYPELFSEDFNDFIENLKETAKYLDMKYNCNFSSMFEISPPHIIKII